MREDGTPDVLVVLHGSNSLQATREIASRPEVWEAGAIAGAGALLGIPIGMLFGRLAWACTAHTARTIGVLVAQQLPTLVVVLAVPASIAFAVVVAQLPARRAVRLRTAEILRSE